MKFKNGRGVPQEKGETWCKGGEAIRMKRGKGNRKRGWFQMFSALFIDL